MRSCESAKSATFAEFVIGLTLQQCQSCGILQKSRSPSDSLIGEAYRETNVDSCSRPGIDDYIAMDLHNVIHNNCVFDRCSLVLRQSACVLFIAKPFVRLLT